MRAHPDGVNIALERIERGSQYREENGNAGQGTSGSLRRGLNRSAPSGMAGTFALANNEGRAPNAVRKCLVNSVMF